jgi:hypothetical protein
VVPYLCSKFHIFDKSILEEYVSHVDGGPHFLKSCLRATQNILLLTTKRMHPSFESLVVINAPCL